LQSILAELHHYKADKDLCNSTGVATFIKNLYGSVAFALHDTAENHVPKYHVNFYKFWWSQELSCLKEKAVVSDRLSKDAGRPRSGPLFSRCSADKRAYRSAVRKQESDAVDRCTNELNDALLLKRGNDFWKCWSSKFGSGTGQCKQVDGFTDHQQIANNFANHFAALSSTVHSKVNQDMQYTYEQWRPSYIGSPHVGTS